MFGRRFAEVIKGRGGRKVKINGRAYYEGVVLQRRSAQIHHDLAMAARVLISGPRRREQLQL